MDAFLSSGQLRALEKVITDARLKSGLHRERTPEGEALAYAHLSEVHWAVNGEDWNIARGAVPLNHPANAKNKRPIRAKA